jgi:hypothetical protein
MRSASSPEVGSLAECRRCGKALRYTRFGWGHVVARHDSHRPVPKAVAS